MEYIKREINESIDEYVMNEDDMLNLIERVFGNEFRVYTKDLLSQSELVSDLEATINQYEREIDEVADMHSDEYYENIKLIREVDRLEIELEELQNGNI